MGIRFSRFFTSFPNLYSAVILPLFSPVGCNPKILCSLVVHRSSLGVHRSRFTHGSLARARVRASTFSTFYQSGNGGHSGSGCHSCKGSKSTHSSHPTGDQSSRPTGDQSSVVTGGQSSRLSGGQSGQIQSSVVGLSVGVLSIATTLNCYHFSNSKQLNIENRLNTSKT